MRAWADPREAAGKEDPEKSVQGWDGGRGIPSHAWMVFPAGKVGMLLLSDLSR